MGEEQFAWFAQQHSHIPDDATYFRANCSPLLTRVEQMCQWFIIDRGRIARAAIACFQILGCQIIKYQKGLCQHVQAHLPLCPSPRLTFFLCVLRGQLTF